ncbi:unnamed protein product, partial [Phaeothamnion confervicola]
KSQVVRLLIEAGAALDRYTSEGRTALDLARASGRKATVSAVLAVNRHVVGARDGHGRPPLLLACQAGDLALVRLLLDAGAKIDVRDASGTTPLHVAAMVGGLPMVRLLVQRGGGGGGSGARRGFLDRTTTSGWTPLMQAVQCGNTAVVSL